MPPLSQKPTFCGNCHVGIFDFGPCGQSPRFAAAMDAEKINDQEAQPPSQRGKHGPYNPRSKRRSFNRGLKQLCQVKILEASLASNPWLHFVGCVHTLLLKLWCHFI